MPSRFVSTILCGNCGRANAPEARFCYGCGSPLTAQRAEASPGAEPAQVTRPSEDAPAQAPGSAGGPPEGGWAPAPLVMGTQAGRRPGGRLEPWAVVVLVVAGCLGALVLLSAAIAWPVFAKAKAKADQSTCASNEKQIALALLSYMTDYDDVFPRRADWCEAVQPYCKSPQIFRCPRAPQQPGGYAYNAALHSARLPRVPRPESMVMAFDATGGWNLAGGRELLSQRHNDGANLAFVDGHVKWVGPSSVSGFDWDLAAPSARGPALPETKMPAPPETKGVGPFAKAPGWQGPGEPGGGAKVKVTTARFRMGEISNTNEPGFRRIAKRWHLEIASTTRGTVAGQSVRLRVTIVGSLVGRLWSDDVTAAAGKVRCKKSFPPGEYLISAEQIGPSDLRADVSWTLTIAADEAKSPTPERKF